MEIIKSRLFLLGSVSLLLGSHMFPGTAMVKGELVLHALG